MRLLYIFFLTILFNQQVMAMNSAHQENNISYYTTSEDLLNAVNALVKQTEVTADIGCGIVPMNYFRPKISFLIEPWNEYADILAERHKDDKSVIIFRSGALDALKMFNDNSVDSIFLLDVIEHMEKEEGKKVLIEAERVARQQIVLFTPLGFMPQHVHAGEKDGWGLSGAEVQEHKSGWLPEDFSKDWEFHICKEYHKVDYKNEKLDKTYGAFFAIRNFTEKAHITPEISSDIRRQLPSEIELQELQAKYDKLQQEYAKLNNHFLFRIKRVLEKVWHKMF